MASWSRRWSWSSRFWCWKMSPNCGVATAPGQEGHHALRLSRGPALPHDFRDVVVATAIGTDVYEREVEAFFQRRFELFGRVDPDDAGILQPLVESVVTRDDDGLRHRWVLLGRVTSMLSQRIEACTDSDQREKRPISMRWPAGSVSQQERMSQSVS